MLLLVGEEPFAGLKVLLVGTELEPEPAAGGPKDGSPVGAEGVDVSLVGEEGVDASLVGEEELDAGGLVPGVESGQASGRSVAGCQLKQFCCKRSSAHPVITSTPVSSYESGILR